MASAPSLPGWIPLKGSKTREFINEATGQVLSRRQFDKLRGIFYEQKAAENKKKDEAAQLLRPAKGRKSARKAAEPEKAKRVIEARATKAKAKKIHRKKITRNLLTPGNMGERIEFETYDDYVEAWQEMQRIKSDIAGYGLGINMVDTRTGRVLNSTVFHLMTPTTFIDEDEFESEMQAELESKLYAEFLSYFMHVAFSRVYAADKLARLGDKRRNHKPGRKRK